MPDQSLISDLMTSLSALVADASLAREVTAVCGRKAAYG
jgi:hypothetical protein